METFIHTKQEALSSEVCDGLIKQYNNCSESIYKARFSTSGGQKTNKEICDGMDIAILPNLLKDDNWKPLLENVYTVLDEGLKEYREKYIGLRSVGPLVREPGCVFTKYPPGGAYHAWHSERGAAVNAKRMITWMFYLNDVTDEGGTAFWYQKHTENAEQGKLVLWSSEWMHIHKGIPSPTQEKYILTGWIGHPEESKK